MRTVFPGGSCRSFLLAGDRPADEAYLTISIGCIQKDTIGVTYVRLLRDYHTCEDEPAIELFPLAQLAENATGTFGSAIQGNHVVVLELPFAEYFVADCID